MEIAKIKNLADELKETPFSEAHVTHIFSQNDKKLLILGYSKQQAVYQVTNLDIDHVSSYPDSDEAALAIKEILDHYIPEYILR